MRTAIYAMAVVLLVGVPVSSADAHDRGYRGYPVAGRAVSGEVHVVFSNADARVIRRYYEPRYRRLPPGLQKRYYRTGTLPPGWQRRFEPMPVFVERQLVVLPSGYRRGVLDGNAVIYAPRTGVIIDATVVF